MHCTSIVHKDDSVIINILYCSFYNRNRNLKVMSVIEEMNDVTEIMILTDSTRM
jgi:hypothetical protein